MLARWIFEILWRNSGCSIISTGALKHAAERHLPGPGTQPTGLNRRQKPASLKTILRGYSSYLARAFTKRKPQWAE